MNLERMQNMKMCKSVRTNQSNAFWQNSATPVVGNLLNCWTRRWFPSFFWHSIILHKNRHKPKLNRNRDFRATMEMLIKHEYFFRVFLSHMCLSLSLGTSKCNWIRIIFFRAMGLQYKSCFDGNAEIQLTSYVPSSKLLIVWLKGGRKLCNSSVWRKTELPSGKKWRKLCKDQFW